MKHVKKVLALVLVSVMVLASLTACGGGAKVKTHKIGIAHYTDAGKGVEALKAFLNGIAETVGCEFVYTTLSTYDEATNLTEIQNLISAGCEGILMSADMGTAAILEECKAAGVYLAGFLCDFNMSFYTAFDAVFGNEYFLGTVSDGPIDGSAYGVAVAKEIIENGYKNIGVIKFPEYAYPMQAVIDAAFRAEIDAYNETAADADKIAVVDTIDLNFAPLEATYLSENPDIDAIFSIAAGASFVYPILVANNRTDVKLYTTGFEGTDDTDNFGSKGNQCYQGTLFSTSEAIVYPLCLMIDKLNGKTYADLPASPERIDCSPMMILSDADMDKVVNSSLYYSADFSKSLLTGEDVKNLCASYNEDATYAKLVETVNNMAVENLK